MWADLAVADRRAPVPASGHTVVAHKAAGDRGKGREVVVRILAVLCGALVPVPDPAEMIRRVAEYSGYTLHYLPKNTDAIRAMEAARIARSSLLIRSLLRYGFKAWSKVF